MRFISPDNGNPFNLDDNQPIFVYNDNDCLIAKLINAEECLYEATRQIIITDHTLTEYDKVALLNELKVNSEEIDEGSFGCPLIPANWELTQDLDSFLDDYIERVKIVQQFLCQHLQFILSG